MYSSSETALTIFALSRSTFSAYDTTNLKSFESFEEEKLEEDDEQNPYNTLIGIDEDGVRCHNDIIFSSAAGGFCLYVLNWNWNSSNFLRTSTQQAADGRTRYDKTYVSTKEVNL